MSWIHDATEEENRKVSRDKGRQDAYYGKPCRDSNCTYPMEYSEGYDEVRNGDMWRYKPAHE